MGDLGLGHLLAERITLQLEAPQASPPLSVDALASMSILFTGVSGAILLNPINLNVESGGAGIGTGVVTRNLTDSSFTFNGIDWIINFNSLVYNSGGAFNFLEMTLLAEDIKISPGPAADSCDVGGGPNDIENVMVSYNATTDEIVVQMILCADVDQKTRYQVYFDYQDTTNLDGDGVDDGPDTLDPNPDCVRTYDERIVYRNGNARGPGIINQIGNTLIFSVTIDELDPGLELGDTVLIWTDTKAKNITDKAPNTESGDDCEKPQVAGEVITLTLD